MKTNSLELVHLLVPLTVGLIWKMGSTRGLCSWSAATIESLNTTCMELALEIEPDVWAWTRLVGTDERRVESVSGFGCPDCFLQPTKSVRKIKQNQKNLFYLN